MTPEVVNFGSKLSRFSEHWSPRVIAEMNDYQFKIVKIQGDFVWHKHDETDETFIVLAGQFCMEFRDRDVALTAGEMIVVPRGIEHRPHSDQECHILLIEPRGVTNTGDSAPNELTAKNDVWV